MMDLIERQTAIDAINTMFAPTPTQKDMVEDCLEILDNLPSAQPEQSEEVYRLYKRAYEAGQRNAQPEVVCADCKHWICHDRRCGFWNHGVKPLDWCCHAERNDNG